MRRNGDGGHVPLLQCLSAAQIDQFQSAVSTLLRHKLTVSEEMVVLHSLSTAAYPCTKQGLANAVRDIATSFITKTNAPGRSEAMDSDTSLHYLQDALVNVPEVFGLTMLRRLQTVFNQSSVTKKKYLTLDTSNAVNYDPLAGDVTQMTWLLSADGLFNPGDAPFKGEFGNITAMRMTDVTLPVNKWRTPRFLELLVVELRVQSMIINERARTHFTFIEYPFKRISFEATTNDNISEMRITNYGKFVFQDPITELISITLAFTDSGRVIPFPRAYTAFDLLLTVVSPNVPILGVTRITLVPTSVAGAPYSLGDHVIIQDFTTGDFAADVLVIDFVNRAEGHTVTSITVPQGSLRLEMAGAHTITTVASAAYAELVNTDRRPIMNIEFDYVDFLQDE